MTKPTTRKKKKKLKHGKRDLVPCDCRRVFDVLRDSRATKPETQCCKGGLSKCTAASFPIWRQKEELKYSKISILASRDEIVILFSTEPKGDGRETTGGLIFRRRKRSERASDRPNWYLNGRMGGRTNDTATACEEAAQRSFRNSGGENPAGRFPRSLSIILSSQEKNPLGTLRDVWLGHEGKLNISIRTHPPCKKASA